MKWQLGEMRQSRLKRDKNPIELTIKYKPAVDSETWLPPLNSEATYLVIIYLDRIITL
jgi:hypothetical protein